MESEGDGLKGGRTTESALGYRTLNNMLCGWGWWKINGKLLTRRVGYF